MIGSKIFPIIKDLLRKFGIDKAIFYTSSARIITAAAGVITIFFIARFLSEAEQGFYYTFGSVLSIQVFFELGFNGVITQYVAHEMSHLKSGINNSLSGSSLHLSRLSSILHFALKWYSAASILLFMVLFISGKVFFERYSQSGTVIQWFLPWMILCFSTSLSFLINPVLSFLEGLGKVSRVALIRLIQQSVTAINIWLLLSINTKLFAMGIGSIIGLMTTVVILIIGVDRKLLVNIWKSVSSEKINYRKEIFPYQWKIALSSLSGYFIFQLFNPVLFATEGAVIAGQMGMTLSALSSLSNVSYSWMTTKVPLYSGLIAQKRYKDLDTIFNRSLRQLISINASGLIIFYSCVQALRYFNVPLGFRFLSSVPLLLMILPVFMNQFVFSWATYLRCHKQEPFLLPSVVGGILTCFSTIYLGKYLGVEGMTAGYAMLTLFGGVVWGYRIFKRKRKEWHLYPLQD